MKVRAFDLAEVVSIAVDLAGAGVRDHGRRVAYIALNIKSALCGSSSAGSRSDPGGDRGTLSESRLLLGGLLHDIGISSSQIKEEGHKFEISRTVAEEHCIQGRQLVEVTPFFSDLGYVIEHHHDDRRSTAGASASCGTGPEHTESAIIHLADRVDVLIDRRTYILHQVDEICRRIEASSRTMFEPDLVDAFRSVAERESFWLDIQNEEFQWLFEPVAQSTGIEVEIEDIDRFASMCGRIVDRKSPYTALHSYGVASCAERLAEICGMTEEDCRWMRIAGGFHDLGKLAVPDEVLHKPDKLDSEEMQTIQQHTYYTYRLLDRVPELRKVRDWAAFHHERLNGSGYPFHLGGDGLDLGCRIMAVADIFTALTEERPYRKGMSPDQAVSILRRLAKQRWLDEDVVEAAARGLLQAPFRSVPTA